MWLRLFFLLFDADLCICDSMKESENKVKDRENFVRLAEQRVNKALKYIRLVGNLSNTSNYHYLPEDVEEIFKIINAEVAECRERFDHKKKEKIKFTLRKDEPIDPPG